MIERYFKKQNIYIKDFNGKEVHEGDIIEAIDSADGSCSTDYPYRGYIKYEILGDCEGIYRGCFVLQSYDENGNDTHTNLLEKIFNRSYGVIIGNIDDNKELLTEKTYYGEYPSTKNKNIRNYDK